MDNNNINLEKADAEITELINKDPELSKIANATRIHIYAAPDNYISFTVESAPTNTQDWIDILEDFVGFLKSPTVSDPEVLGKHQERYL